MPLPSEVLKDAKKPEAPARRSASDLISADLGDGSDLDTIHSVPQVLPQVAQAQRPAAPTRPASSPEEPAGTDQAQVKALVNAALKSDPTLALQIKSKGPLAKERINLTFDPETLRRWRDLALAKNQSPSTVMSDGVLPWVKANADRTSLIWAKKQVDTRRKVALRHELVASEGVGDLAVGSSPEAIYYPVATLNTVKTLWSASGLKKKAFFEACIYLYLEIQVPRK